MRKEAEGREEIRAQSERRSEGKKKCGAMGENVKRAQTAIDRDMADFEG